MTERTNGNDLKKVNIEGYDILFYREEDGHYYVKHPNMEWVAYPAHQDGSADLDAMHYLNELEIGKDDFIHLLLWLVEKLTKEVTNEK